MIKIRSRRLTKKGQRLRLRVAVIFIKVFVILYLLFVTMNHLTSSTTAFFNDIEKMRFSLGSANSDRDWDKSSLQISEVAYGTCEEVYALVTNVGNGDMEGTVPFKVYLGEIGGTLLKAGKVPALETGETYKMVYDPRQNPDGPLGTYWFKTYQRSGHPGKSSDNGLKAKIELTGCEEAEGKVEERYIVPVEFHSESESETGEKAKEDKKDEGNKEKQATDGQPHDNKKTQTSESADLDHRSEDQGATDNRDQETTGEANTADSNGEDENSVVSDMTENKDNDGQDGQNEKNDSSMVKNESEEQNDLHSDRPLGDNTQNSDQHEITRKH